MAIPLFDKMRPVLTQRRITQYFPKQKTKKLTQQKLTTYFKASPVESSGAAAPRRRIVAIAFLLVIIVIIPSRRFSYVTDHLAIIIPLGAAALGLGHREYSPHGEVIKRDIKVGLKPTMPATLGLTPTAATGQ